MKRMICSLSVVLVLITWFTNPIEAQVFIDLGAGSVVYGMSDDGQVVVGTIGLGGPAFKWTPGGGIETLTEGSDPYVSGDGMVIAGSTNVGGIDMAAVWVNGSGWQPLDPLPGGAPCGNLLSSVWAVSGDGSAIVGLAWLGCADAHAFKWDSINGMVDLGSLDGGSSRANGVSANGSTVVGWDESSTGFWRGARWVDGAESLLDPIDSVGDAWGANSGGSVIVGAFAGPTNDEAYRWTEAGGIQPIGVLPGTQYKGYAIDLSEDGNLIIGYCGFGFDRRGFAWTPAGGMGYIEDFLTNLGVTIPANWILDTPQAVSPDKNFISGWGLGPGGIRGWLVDLNDELPMFNDGFESGDTASWARTTGE